jgi:hydrogenase-4 component B
VLRGGRGLGSVSTLVALPGWFLLCAVSALLLGRRPGLARGLGYGGAAVGAVGAIALALDVLVQGDSRSVALFRPAPFLSLGLRVDPLAAAFLLALGAGTLVASLGAIGYARHYDGHGGPRLAAACALFVATMLVVLLADGVYTFLLAWETMSLVGYLLVVHEHEREDVRRAGFIYLVMSHLGTAFVVAGFLWLAALGGTMELAGLAAVPLAPLTRDVAYVALLLGFATKAGAVPVHVWLPRAHPVAPSHVSALMSGVMLKVALYGIARVAFDVLAGGPAWWGWLVLALGLLSAVLGILRALMERDLKRVLAYSSIENVGIVLVGFGAALVLRAGGLDGAAALALTAGLLHALNHALFKSLLFLGAGAVDRATGTRDLEKLGGLARRMPQTAALILVGCLSIAALPPLNGFASEWLTFQALLATGTTGRGAAVAAAAAAALLALSGGLAAACFVRVYGVAFLGLPRSPAVEGAGEAGVPVRLALAAAAGLCLAIGLLPGAAIGLLGRAAGAVPADWASSAATLPTPGAAGSTPSAALGIGLLLAAGLWLALRLLGPAPFRRGAVWVCGFPLESRMQYGATAFAEPLRLFFRALLRPERSVHAEWVLAPHFVGRLTTRGSTQRLIEHHLYTPTTRALLRFANQLRVIQSGSLRLYLLYLFAALLTLLAVAR